MARTSQACCVRFGWRTSQWSAPTTGWRTSQWRAPTTKELVGSDYATDREWHEARMWYSSEWASDPSQWSQCSKRAKPTHSHPSDDERSDVATPAGTTSKTWKPGPDRQTILVKDTWSAGKWSSIVDECLSTTRALTTKGYCKKRSRKCGWRVFRRWCYLECPIHSRPLTRCQIWMNKP